MNTDALTQFSIPIKGLRDGYSEYHFSVDSTFFEAFEDTMVEDGKIELNFSIEKRPEFFELYFNLSGTVKVDCDRCLTAINLPIKNEERLLLKYSEKEEEEDLEVVYILPETAHFNIAKYVYEFISLAIPMVKIYDCQSETEPPCDQETLKRLEGASEKVEQGNENPTWDALKDIKFK